MSQPWEGLFPVPASGSETITLQFRLIRKHGQPLLLVPPGGDVLAASLSLYPAQSRKARLARSLVEIVMKVRLPIISEVLTIPCTRDLAFLRFLDPTPQQSSLPRFAVFFCNPRAGGQRFILLTFDQQGMPTRAIKAGVGVGAGAVVQRETEFLRQMANMELPRIPKVNDSFESPSVKAVALDYVSGVTPEAGDLEAAGEVLLPWLRTDKQVQLRDLSAWQQLRAVSTDPLVVRLEQVLAGTTFCSAVHHGDFAPWNIRIQRATGEWFVLDWERGEMAGPPGWDWFHLLIQPAILVQQKPPIVIATELEGLLGRSEFMRYARAAGIEMVARELVLAYLLHSRDVTQPTEGAASAVALLEILRQRWLRT